MSDVTWIVLESLIKDQRNDELIAQLSGLDDRDRKSLVAPLRSFSRTTDERGLSPWRLFSQITLVGAAVQPDAKTTASWLRRFGQDFRGDTDLVRGEGADSYSYSPPTESPFAEATMTVLRDRQPAWLPALLPLVAAQLPYDYEVLWTFLFVEALREHLGAPPPTDTPYVTGWVHRGWQRSGGLVPLLRRDPRFADLVPLIFEIDDLAHHLRGSPDYEGLIVQVLDAVSQGLVDRDAVLDAIVARLQRGGRPQPTIDFAAIHDLVAPTTEEILPRARDYIPVLQPGSARSAAGVAQRALFALHDADLLQVGLFAEASEAVLARTEKNLVRAQLARLASHAKSQPNDVPILAVATAAAFGNAAPDIQRDAINLIAAWSPHLPPTTAAEVRTLGTHLPHDLARDLAAALRQSAHISPDPQVPPRDTSPVALPAPAALLAPAAATSVQPIASAAKAVEQLLLVLRNPAWTIDALAPDRLIEALPRLGASTPEDLRDAAGPILTGNDFAFYRDPLNYQEYYSHTAHSSLLSGLVALLAASVGDPSSQQPVGRHSFDKAPEVVLMHRTHALASTLQRQPSVRCVSLPTWSDGLIDAADLHRRLATAAREGWDPEPLDLEQALLRLDLRPDPPVDFADITSHAGAVASAWVTAGLPPLPELQLLTIQERVSTGYYLEPHEAAALKPQHLTVATFARPPENDGPSETEVDQTTIWGLLCSPTVSDEQLTIGYDPGSTYPAWSTLAPFHPDLVAAHLCLDLINARTHSCDETGTLVALAESPGPIGTATLTAIGYGLGAKLPARRSAAVDALLVLAGREKLDSRAFGATLIRLLADGSIVLRRIVPPLSDLARAGAAEPLWQTLRTMLEHYLAQDQRPPGFVDVLTLAAEAADLARAHDPVEGLDNFATGRSKTRQVTEARRLQTILGAPER